MWLVSELGYTGHAIMILNGVYIVKSPRGFSILSPACNRRSCAALHLVQAFTRGIAAFGEPQQRKAAPDEQQFGDHASSNVNPAEFPSDTDFQPQKRNPRGTSRRMVDAEDEGGGKLRGSFRNFVHAGELGKPLQDKVSRWLTRGCRNLSVFCEAHSLCAGEHHIVLLARDRLLDQAL